MALKIITADERLAEAQGRNSILLAGRPKIGKTTQLYTLDADSTLALDFEGGFKSVQTWRGHSIEIRSFIDAMSVAALVGGVDPSVSENDFFSEKHCENALKEIGHLNLNNYKTIFFDSFSDLSSACFKWAKQQPDAWAVDKNTKQLVPNNFGLYGLLGKTLSNFARHMQHAPGITTVFTVKLDQVADDFNRLTYQLNLDGQQIKNNLPGIVDQIISYSTFDLKDDQWTHNWESGLHRAFCCTRLNPWGLPAGNRTLGNLEMIEEPNLGKLLEKINAPAKNEMEKIINK